MLKLIGAQLRVMLHSRFCLLFLGAALLLSVVLFFDNGDVIGSLRELEEQVEQIGFDGMKRINQAEGAESIEDVMALLRVRQVVAAPAVASGGMFMLLLLLPGVTLAPALTRTLSIQWELRRYGRVKPLLSRMALSWVFCLLLSTGLYFLALRIWTDPDAAAPGQLLRYWIIVQFYVLALLCYSYFMHTLFRRAAVAASVMILAEAVLHEIIPGLRIFYPISLLPYYNQQAYLNTAGLLGADCPAGTFLTFCGVCLLYIVICPILAILLFRRREVR